MDRQEFANDHFDATPEPTDLSSHYLGFVERFGQLSATRRSLLLGVAGASVGLPLIGALARAASQFTIQEESGALTIAIGDLPAWRIRADWFDGTPSLEVRRAAGSLRVRLRRALFPGTDLPANLLLEARLVQARWVARLRLDSLGFCADFPFDTWLLGYQRAQGRAAVGQVSFRSARDLRFEHLHGACSIGADWNIDLPALENAAIRLGSRRAAMSAMRFELNRPAQAEPIETPRMHAWPELSEAASFEFQGTTPALSLVCNAADFCVQASARRARLSARQAGPGSRLTWRADDEKSLEMTALDASVSVDYDIDARAVVSGSAVAQVRDWHRSTNFAAEFVVAAGDGRIALASNAPCDCSPAPSMPRARRFVVRIPGCDHAFFRTHGPASVEPLGANIRAFAMQRIPLDDYELVLRRASDAFSVTLRFRGIHLEFSGMGWRLAPDAFTGSATSLIEYDFGSQHLLEEAVYISDWCDAVAACPGKSANGMPVSDEVAVRAILQANADASGRAWADLGSALSAGVRIPVDRAELAAHRDLLDPARLIIHLHAQAATAFDSFKASSSGLQTFLNGRAGTPWQNRTQRARSTHLLFDIGGIKHLELSADALMSWAALGTADRSTASLDRSFLPVVSSRAAAVGTRTITEYDGTSATLPQIRRPRSLAEKCSSLDDYASAIEVPARLVMNQIERDPARWVRSATRMPRPGANAIQRPRNELWSVRLADAKLRAVFTPDAAPTTAAAGEPTQNCSDVIDVDIFHGPAPFTPGAASGEFRASTDARDRHEIVALTALYGYPALKGSQQVIQCDSTPPPYAPAACGQSPAADIGCYVPLPIDARILQLTSLGASFKYQGRWDPPANAVEGDGALSVTRYDHHGQIGRDIAARVEYKGFLFPLGHPAILVKLTERRFCLERRGKVIQSTAKLVQRFFIHIPEFTRAFPAINQPNENRPWAHAAIEMKEATTPDLEDPSQCSVAGLGQSAFMPKTLCGDDILFEFTDAASGAHYSAPMYFIDNYVAHTCGPMAGVINAWRAITTSAIHLSIDMWPTVLVHGYSDVLSGKLPYVEGVSGSNTDIETDRIIFGVQAMGETGIIDDDVPSAGLAMNARMEAQRQPPFYPVRRRGRVALPQIATIAGTASKRYLLQFDDFYVANGLDATLNPGKVFGRFVDPSNAPMLDFGGDTSKSGGFASPSTSIAYASVLRGLIGDRTDRLMPLDGSQPPVRPLAQPRARRHAVVAGPQPDNAHRGDFDPADFFSTFIGNAKLLGVVRVADILEVALEASGQRIPTINREQLFDLAEDAVRAVMPAIDGAIERALQLVADPQEVPPAAAALLLPDLQALQQQQQALDKLLNDSGADPSQAVAQIQAFAHAATRVASDADKIVNEPQMLLPPDVLASITAFNDVLAALKGVNPQVLWRSLVVPALKSYLQQLAQDKIDALLAQVQASPEFDSLRSVAEDLAARAAALALAIDQAADAGLAMLGTLLQSIEDFATEVRFLAASAESAFAAVETALTQNWFAVTDTSTSGMVSTVMQATGTFTTAIGVILSAEEDKLAGTGGLDADQRGDAGRALARARQAASSLSDTLQDNIARLKVLVSIEQAPPPAPPASYKRGSGPAPRLGWDIKTSGLRNLLGRLDYLAALPRHWFNIVARLSDVLQAITDCTKAIDAQGLAECQNVAADLQAALQQFCGTLESGVSLNLGKIATSLTNIEAALRSAGVADELVASLGLPSAVGMIKLIANALPGGTQVFDLGGVCTGAGPDGSDKWPRKMDLDALSGACDRLIQWLAYQRELSGTLVGYVERLNAFEAAVSQAAAQVVEQLCVTVLQGDVAKVLASLQDKVKQVKDLAASAYVSQELLTDLGNLYTALGLPACAGLTLGQLRTWWVTLGQTVSATGNLLAKSLSIAGIGKLVDVNRALQEVVASLGVPTRMRVTYDWVTSIHEFPDGDSAVFEPLDDCMLSIHASAEAGLQGGPPSASLSAQMSSFRLNLFGKGASNFLSITFKPLTMTLKPGAPLDCDTDVTEVVPGEALGFVSSLQALFGGSSGFLVVPTFRGVTVSYSYRKDMEELGGFLVQNIAFSIGVELPFDNSPVRFWMQLADKLVPFLISADIYGGGGFFGIRTRADTLEVLEASFEFGAVAGFSFSILEGSGRITAGIYIRMGGDAPVIEGFFCAVGDMSIAGVIHVGGSLRVSLSYTGSAMSGNATYEFHMSIGFMKLSYSVNVQYAKTGDKPNSGQNKTSSLATRETLALQGGARAGDDPAPDHPYTADAWRHYWTSIAEVPLDEAIA